MLETTLNTTLLLKHDLLSALKREVVMKLAPRLSVIMCGGISVSSRGYKSFY